MTSYTLYDPFSGVNRTFGTLWTTDAEFTEWIHPHWRRFSPPDPLYNYMVGLYVGLMGFVGIIGNSITIILFFVSDRLRSAPNALIINLAISDLSFAAINGFPLKTIAAFNQQWTWGKKACILYGFSGGLFGFASLTTLAFIALDRYFAIVKPFGAVSRNPATRITVMLITIWLWSLTWAVPPFFGYGSYIPEGFHTSCTFDYLSSDTGNLLFNAGMYLFAFICPVSVIIFSYASIVKAVHDSELLAHVDGAKRHRSGAATNDPAAIRSDLQTVRLSAVLVLLYLASWGPYAFVCFLALLGQRNHLTPFTAELPVLFAKSSCMYNPIVYALMHRNFRHELANRMPSWLCQCKDVTVSDTTNSTRPKRDSAPIINTSTDLKPSGSSKSTQPTPAEGSP